MEIYRFNIEHLISKEVTNFLNSYFNVMLLDDKIYNISLRNNMINIFRSGTIKSLKNKFKH